jgi:Sec-independent protein translocase protein TatA
MRARVVYALMIIAVVVLLYIGPRRAPRNRTPLRGW